MRAAAAALAAGAALAAEAAQAQGITLDLGGEGGLATRSLQLIAVLTLLGVAPGIAVMITCFPFIVTVLSLLRQGLGLPQSPPNMVIVTLALFLTWFVMDPVLTAAWEAGLGPLWRGEMELQAALTAALGPFRGFMSARIDPDTFAALAALRPDPPGDPATSPLSILVPSFLLSEIQRAFEIGFLIYLPFLVIDLVVAAVLMAMGMMMVPPAMVALPFKLAFFVVADGWARISAALVQGYL